MMNDVFSKIPAVCNLLSFVTLCKTSRGIRINNRIMQTIRLIFTSQTGTTFIFIALRYPPTAYHVHENLYTN